MKIRARRIVPGHATGTALVLPTPFSFVGGVDLNRGTVSDADPNVDGQGLKGRIFCFSHGKGSTVGSYILYGLVKRAVAPAAIVNVTADAIVAVGATLGEIPMVDRVDTAGLRSGDRIVVDADRGAIDLPDVHETPVVSVILRNRGRILIVRRSEAVGSFRGRWSAVSGYIEGRERTRERAAREVREETGIRGLRFRGAASPILARHESTIYVIHPFLFDVRSRGVRLDWENVDHRWIRPVDLDRFATVPRLKDVVRAVLPPAG